MRPDLQEQADRFFKEFKELPSVPWLFSGFGKNIRSATSYDCPGSYYVRQTGGLGSGFTWSEEMETRGYTKEFTFLLMSGADNRCVEDIPLKRFVILHEDVAYLRERLLRELEVKIS